MKNLNFEGVLFATTLSHSVQSTFLGFEEDKYITKIEMKSATMPFVGANFEIISDDFFDVSPNKKYKIIIQEVE